MGGRGFSQVAKKRPHANSKAAKLQRRKDRSKQLASARAQQKTINELLADVRKPRPRSLAEAPEANLANQILAAEERIWRSTWAMKLRRHGRRKWIEGHPNVQWKDFRIYAATFAKAEWIVPALSQTKLPVIRKQIQRQAKRLSTGYIVTGVIDVCWFRDDIAGVRGWSFHVHLTIQLPGTDEPLHIVEIQNAFPYRSAPAAGVSRASEIVRAYDPQGWDHYQDKLFQLTGIRQRITRPDPFGGKRLKTHKPPLTRQQQSEVARFFRQVRASDLMIWVGYRRYGNQVREMAVSPIKMMNSAVEPDGGSDVRG